MEQLILCQGHFCCMTSSSIKANGEVPKNLILFEMPLVMSLICQWSLGYPDALLFSRLSQGAEFLHVNLSLLSEILRSGSEHSNFNTEYSFPLKFVSSKRTVNFYCPMAQTSANKKKNRGLVVGFKQCLRPVIGSPVSRCILAR